MAESQSENSNFSVKQSEIFDAVLLLLGSGIGPNAMGNKIRRLYASWIALSETSRKELDKYLIECLPPSYLTSYETLTVAFAMWENLQKMASSIDNHPLEWINDSYVAHMSEICEEELTRLITRIEYIWAHSNFEMSEHV
ncbi:uncharacterized protein [Centruroides vittatus]|uniref:uncharacterized protein n=1 Tax=Centruroides vittatus TaxID=120091 RepID=UPI00350FB0A0